VSTILIEHQRLSTSGARAVQPFALAGAQYLIVPQLAVDVPGTPAHMNGGDSDTGAQIYRWQHGRLVEDGLLPLSGGEDAEFFNLGEESYLVTAGVRSGYGPYRYNIDQVLYKWISGSWAPIQTFAGFAAKQWHFFRIGHRAFLALAQGVTLEHIEATNPRNSRIYEWNGRQFDDFQTLEGMWGYNWESFEIAGQSFLAYADHVGESVLLAWNGSFFSPLQSFSKKGGRCFRYFAADGEHYAAFANIQGDSTLYRWGGEDFVPCQTLGGPGGREFCVVRTISNLYLLQINFIQGEPSAPRTNLTSRVFKWTDGKLVLVEEFPTAGGTDAAVFSADGKLFVAVSNSLTIDVRFRTDTIIYRFNG
jgi:EPTP domain-containing protein